MSRLNIILRILLIFLSCLYYMPSYAQINVKVDINGVSGDIADNVRLFLSIEQQKTHALLSEARLRRLHKRAPKEISDALQPFGYYRPAIDSALTQPAPNQWLASYTIKPGVAIPIAQFNLSISEEMRNDPEFQALLLNIPLRQGGIFNHLEYEKMKTDLARLAAERGYFSARFTEHRVEIDLDKYEARVNVNYQGGPRYRFGEILLQQDVLDPNLLLRYIPFEKGSPYHLAELVDLQQALNDTEYFQSIEVSPGKPQADSTEIPVSVMLKPRKRHQYTIGLGFGTNTGMRTKFGWQVSPVNRRGHRLNTEAKVSEIGYSVSAHYRVPVLNPRTDQIVYTAGIVNEDTDTSDSTVKTIGATLNRSHNDWRQSIYLNYQQEKFVIAEDRGISDLLIPGINWSRTWGQNVIYTIDGLRFDIGLRGASKKLFSDTDFFQLQGGIKSITPLGRHDRIIVHGRLGATWTQEFNQLPTTVRFFAGGAQSVRGYTYQSLGPKDANGEVIGGQYLMLGSIEYEHSFTNKWGGALFYDAGNAIDNLDDKLERGAGFGLRWKSPIGPVRIDLANAISRDGHPWRLHINIGPDL